MLTADHPSGELTWGVQFDMCGLRSHAQAHRQATRLPMAQRLSVAGVKEPILARLGSGFDSARPMRELGSCTQARLPQEDRLIKWNPCTTDVAALARWRRAWTWTQPRAGSSCVRARSWHRLRPARRFFVSWRPKAFEVSLGVRNLHFALKAASGHEVRRPPSPDTSQRRLHSVWRDEFDQKPRSTGLLRGRLAGYSSG